MSFGPASVTRFMRRVTTALENEIGQLRPLQHAVDLATRAIPTQVGNQMRAAALRARGIEVGRGTLVYGPPEFSSGQMGAFAKMVIGDDCVIDAGCAFELGEAITIGNRVTLGYNVMIITTSHELGPREHRAGEVVRSAVRIEDGVWIGPRSIVLPGVTIGAGAVVDASSVVNKNVAPNTRVRGTPARQVEELAP